MNLQSATWLAFYQYANVVHPRIVGAQMATSDEQHCVGVGTQRCPQARQVGNQLGWGELNFAAWGAQHFGNPRNQRAIIHTVRMLFQHRHARTRWVGPEALAERADAQQQIQDAIWPAQRTVFRAAQGLVNLVGVATGDHAGVVAHGGLDERTNADVIDCVGVNIGAQTLHDARQFGQNLPLVGYPRWQVKHRWAVVRHAAQRKVQQRQVVVAAIQA